MTLQEIINNCRAQDGVIFLPNVAIERSLYLQLKKLMQSNGAKWKGGKAGGFVCHNAGEVLQRMQDGDLRDLKKDYQFFATPVELGEAMVGDLETITPGMRILEPSAGQGALITAMRNRFGSDICPDYCELMPECRSYLTAHFYGCRCVGENFMQTEGLEGRYDRIVANPPFSKNQDIRHIRRMYDCLNPTGRMVTLCGPHFEFAKDRESCDFRGWLYSVHAHVRPVPKGTFRSSGTDIEARKIVIYKD